MMAMAQVARTAAWAEGELDAAAALAAVHQALDQPLLAAAAHERCLNLATGTLDRPQHAQAAYRGLVGVYAQHAEQCKQDGNLEGALDQLRHCLQV
jgi:hypothetical protein